MQARAGTLADITGPGGWSGDVFGTGVTTTVGFEVAAAPDGTPDIVNITTSDATAEIGEVDHDIGDEAARAKVSILFTNGIEQRTLSIRVTAASSDDASSAKVSVALSDVSGRRLPAEQVVGAHTWNGMLCDGTAASITYTVNADGSISGVTAIPATASIDIARRPCESGVLRRRTSSSAGEGIRGRHRTPGGGRREDPVRAHRSDRQHAGRRVARRP